jgi:PAS domain S-box-containing protein
VRHIEDGFLLTDEQGVVVVWNPKMEEFFGIPAADALGRPLWELHARLLPGDPPGRDRERVGRESREAIEAALAGEPTQAAMTLNRVGEAHVSDGSSRRSVQLLPFSAETDGGFVVGAVCRDTTAMRRELAEEARTERLTALQDLARGVAHDFNNLLTTILGSAGSAREELQDVAWDLESIHRHLVRAEEAVLEARGLVTQLLLFARGEGTELRPVRLASVVRQQMDLVLSGTEVQGGVPVRSVLEDPPDLWEVRGDPDQLAQVVRNLILNAAQAASPVGGEVRVSLRNVDESPGEPRVELEVADDGPGIPEALSERIFDPFFSTKADGTGLGLSVVCSVVARHGGTMTAENRSEGGACFTVTLPAVAGRPEDEERGVDGIPERRGQSRDNAEPMDWPQVVKFRGRRVLVVEDEPTVRAVVTRMLRSLGFQVTSAGSPSEAVELVGRGRSAWKHGDGTEGNAKEALAFDLVLTDLRLGVDGDGLDVVTFVRDVHPKIPVLITSGTLGAGVAGAAAGLDLAPELARGTVLLGKPYTFDELSTAVWDLLGG